MKLATPVFLKDARPTQWAREAFTQGECWYLAWHLNQLSGYPLIAMQLASAPPGDWFHVMVATPKQRLLDVHGHQTYTQFQELFFAETKGLRLKKTELQPRSFADYVTTLFDDPADALDPYYRKNQDDFESATRQLARTLLQNPKYFIGVN